MQVDAGPQPSTPRQLCAPCALCMGLTFGVGGRGCRRCAAPIAHSSACLRTNFRPAHPSFHSLPLQFNPSPLLGGRLGGGWEASSVRRRSFVGGRRLPNCRLPARGAPTPLLVSPLEGGRDCIFLGELVGGWLGRCERAAAIVCGAPIAHSSACLRTNFRPAHPSFHSLPLQFNPSPLLGGRLGGGWEASSVRRRSFVGGRRLPNCRLPARGAPTPLFVSPLEGGRDCIGEGGRG